MTFTEKLARLTEGENKSKLAKDAGLPSTAISNYITKRQIPRGDTALAIARALHVPLDWLLDDQQDWPAPKLDKPTVSDLSLDVLLEELARRYRHDILRALSMLEDLKTYDWGQVAKRLFEVGLFEDPPADIARPVSLYSALDTWVGLMKLNYDLDSYIRTNHARLPGAERRPEELDPSAFNDRVYEWEKSEPFLRFIAVRPDMRRGAKLEPDHDPDEGRRYVLAEIEEALAERAGKSTDAKSTAKALATDAARSAARGRLEQAGQQHTSNEGRAPLKKALKDVRTGDGKPRPKK